MNNIDIIYECGDFLAINKPVGVVVNDCDSQKHSFTIQVWMRDKYPELFKDHEIPADGSEIEDFYTRNGIVHRIDRDTSGVLLIAKNEQYFNLFIKLFAKRHIHKEYIAIVYGTGEELAEGNEFTIDAPIARNPKSRAKFAIVEGGRDAVTKFIVDKKIKKDNEYYTVIKCYPKTGRTHQIRLHLAALRHPVVGDILYSGQRRGQREYDIYKRHFLHSSAISFVNPINKKEIKIGAPIPSEFTSFINP